MTGEGPSRGAFGVPAVPGAAGPAVATDGTADGAAVPAAESAGESGAVPVGESAADSVEGVRGPGEDPAATASPSSPRGSCGPSNRSVTACPLYFQALAASASRLFWISLIFDGSRTKSCRSFHSPLPSVPPKALGARSDMS